VQLVKDVSFNRREDYIKAAKVVGFKAGKALKEAVKEDSIA